ncbi:helix-turn-helix domain-containing protein [Clostridium oryzae]|uniref:HTH-type transcriptional regulator Xre n=1 Tax=Clostridium oryzae TaxID=1450648 RepID=A0A1V4IPE8_9CLOT|nr:helix-turn-helix transcriptional regulator [Clostridium oryzae]OPJ61931.1 HTH-type transcriptional regulator Xre [Clostridium oryzae]
MDKLSIGETIFRLRKEKGFTQDQLGSFIGVSTAAVSKWESGISYPDITLLPVLASLFNVSIDKLMNYKAELSDEEVMSIYAKCEAIFSGGSIEEAVKTSKEYLKKYPNSYYLKFRTGFLFVMYSWKTNDEEDTRNMIAFAIKLFEEVVENCSREDLVEAALFQLGALYPQMDEQDKAIEALNKIHKSSVDPNDLLASIYIEKNELKKAREILQSKLYKCTFDITLACMSLAKSYAKEEKDLSKVEQYFNLMINIKKTINDEKGEGLSLYNEYLHFGRSYLLFNETEKSMEMLNNMIEDMRHRDINEPGEFKSCSFFNYIPVSKRTITMNLYDNLLKIFEEPIFDVIREREDFKRILSEINDLKEKHLR